MIDIIILPFGNSQHPNVTKRNIGKYCRGSKTKVQEEYSQTEYYCIKEHQKKSWDLNIRAK